jgi:hypothetical protein
LRQKLTKYSPALTEKENTFNTPTFVVGDNEKELEVERVKSLDADHLDDFTIDPFKPFDDLPDEPNNILTIRALFVGLCCGALVNASNVYLGLKTGWTFTANLFGVSGERYALTLPSRTDKSVGHRRFCRHQVPFQGCSSGLAYPGR